MPKKKKAGKQKGKKGKGGGEEGKAKDAEPKEYQPPGATNKELDLKNEMDELTSELTTLKKQVEDLRRENGWLQDEADKTKTESQDYQTYVSRKAQKRQSLVVSLSDHNQQQLREIAKQREELLRDYEDKRTGLTATLLEKASELSRVQRDLKTLEPYMALQHDQDEEIGRLERELEEQRFCHEDRVRGLKTKFLQERKDLEEESHLRVRAMADMASKQASDCLREHTQKIRSENQRLRAELQQLIETTNDLQLQRKRLEKQYQSLLREHQYNQDLQLMEGTGFRGLENGSGLGLGIGEGSGSGVSLPQVSRLSSMRR